MFVAREELNYSIYAPFLTIHEHDTFLPFPMPSSLLSNLTAQLTSYTIKLQFTDRNKKKRLEFSLKSFSVCGMWLCGHQEAICSILLVRRRQRRALRTLVSTSNFREILQNAYVLQLTDCLTQIVVLTC